MKIIKSLILFILLISSFYGYSQITLPYTESFESGFGDWTQITSDDFDWTWTNTATPPLGTGPDAAFDGSGYICIDATDHYDPSKYASIQATFDFSDNFMPILSFNYHMFGDEQMGNLYIYINDGSGWIELWNQFNNQGNAWYNHKICLGEYADKNNVSIKIKAQTIDGDSSDIAIDKIEIRDFKIESISHTDVTCGGYSDGDISISVSGGFLPYDYSIDDGTYYTEDYSTSHFFSGLPGSHYSVKIRDEANCVLMGGVVEIDEPEAPSVNISKANVQPCAYDMNGQILIVASGANPLYQYSISGMGGAFQSSNSFTGLDVGTYDIAVKTDNGCIVDGGSTNIIAPKAISINSVDIVDIATCNGDNNGSINVNATGGNVQLSYSINNGTLFQTPSYFGGLTSGTYDIIIEDSEHCRDTAKNIFVDEPSIVHLDMAHVSHIAGCFEDNDGTITLEGSGGTGTIYYSIDGGYVYQENNIFENLSAGDYEVFCRDENNCTSSSNELTINQPDELILDDAITTDIQSCFGASDGQIEITAHGGTGTIYYSIDNGVNFESTNIFTGLAQGSYFPVIKDDNNCQVVGDEVIINQPTQLQINAVTPFNVNSCFGDETGSIYISAYYGTPPLQYSVDGGTNYQDASAFVGVLGAGDYNIRVKDANECYVDYSQTITLTDPDEIIISDEITSNTSCYNANDGSIYINADGGTGSLLYSINNGISFPYAINTITYQPAGTYTITIKDDNDCEVTGSTLIIEQPEELIFSSIDVIDIADCYGDETGSITLNVEGGTGTYIYSVDYGTSTQEENIFSNLPAGTNYYPYVEDENGCYIQSTPVTIVQPSQLFFQNATHTDIHDCHGVESGTITISATGGTTPLSYSIDSGDNYFENDGIFTNLGAGTYNISITDANNCTISGGIETIFQPDTLVIDSIISKPVICNGQSNGEIHIYAKGGQPQLRYSLNGGTSYNLSSQFYALQSNTYNVVIKDGYDCTAEAVIILNEPTVFFLVPDGTTGTDITTCNGDNNGTITTEASGGVEPYSYSYTWLNHFTSDTQESGFFENLFAGSYYITAIDANGCLKTSELINIEQPTIVQISDYDFTDISCNGLFDGTITINGTGGTGENYQYTINSGDDWTDNNNFTNLSEGNYVIGVRDENECEVVNFVTVPIHNPNQIEIQNIYTTNISCHNYANGELTIIATGGTDSHQFSVNGIDFQESNSFENLPEGTYYPTVQDINGCTAQWDEVIFEQPTYESGFSVSQNIGCDPLEVNFYKNNPDITYLWIYTENDTSYVQNPATFTYTNNSSQIQEYEVEVISFYQTCRDTSYQTITVLPSPNLYFVVDEHELYYPDTTTHITNFTTDYDQISWDFGDGQTSTISDITEHSYSSCGEYPLTLSALNSYNCPASYIDTIKVIPLQPDASFFTNNLEGCMPLTCNFNNLSSYSNKYTWYFGEGTFSDEENPSFIFTEAGDYNVTLSTEGDCGTTSSFQKTITVFPSPVAEFTIVNDTVTVGQTVGFFDMSNETFFNWNFGDSTYSTEQFPQKQYDKPGSYDVTLIAGSENRCTDSITIKNAVLVIDNLIFDFPAYFSPNGDNINEFLEPSTNLVKEAKLTIFNRLGHIVFQTDDPLNVFWDGNDRNGNACPMEVYVWIAEGKYVGDSRLQEKGNVTLIR